MSIIPEYTLEDALDSIEHICTQLNYGCRNGDCCIHKPVGMHTNAGCRCYPYMVARHLKRIAEAIENSMGKSIEWKRKIGEQK